MSAGYIKLITGVETEVTEPGNIYLNRKFGSTGRINIKTAEHPEKMILCISDDLDYDMYVEEDPADLAEITDRINEILELERNGEL